MNPVSRPAPVGRDHEITTARRLLTAAFGGRGGLLLIGGAAGIGKTALADALAGEATQAGGRVLRGYCYDRTETPPYGPWIECLAQYRAPDPGEASPGPAPPDPTQAPNQEAFFEQARGFFAALAAERPLVLVLEDLHWADAASLDLLRSLARAQSLVSLGLLLVVTYRDDELHRNHPLAETIPLLVRDAPVERLALRPLDHAAARALIHARYDLSDSDAGRLAAYLMQRAEGNALFMTELLRTLEEERFLVREADQWHVGTLAHAPVPPLLRQVIDTLLTRLGEPSYALLGMAAVIGQEVPLALWGEVAQTDEETLVALVERAERAQVVVAWTGGDGIRFAHALIREVLYEGVHAMRRRRLHGHIGEVLAASPTSDPDAVAYHLQHAGDERAVDWLERAAERAADSAALIAAADRYAAAFALLDLRQGDASQRGWFRLLAASLRHYQDPDPANSWVEEAAHLAVTAGDASLAARALAMRGLLRTYRGEVREGLADLGAAVDAIDALPRAAESDRRREERIDLIANRGTRIAFLGYAGYLAEARSEGEQLLATLSASSPSGAVGVLGDTYSGLSITYALLGEPNLATQSYAGAVAAYQAMGHQVLAVMNQREELVCAVMPYRADDLGLRERAAAAVEAATRRLVGVGTNATMDPQYARLPLLILEGRWQEARHIAGAGEWNVYQPSHHLNFVVGLLARAQGDRELAWELVREAWSADAIPGPGDMFVPFTVPLLLLGAALALDDHDLHGARKWLDAHAGWMDWMGATLGRSEGQALEAEWWRAASDLARARMHAERALTHATAPRQPLALLAAHRLLGVLDADERRHAHAEQHFATALALADACHVPYERALVLLTRAELLAATGEPAGAITLLDEVRSICTPLNATPTLSRVDALTARLAGGEGGIASSPLRFAPLREGLSAREVEVLQLLAEGLTNPQIAERLFLSRRTVSSHLVSIYGKLGVTTRAGATRAALEHNLI